MKRFLAILKLIVLLIIIFGPLLYVYFFAPQLIDQFRTMEGVNEYLEQYKAASIFVYIGLQFFQIVISVIPGQFIPFAAGYAYGFWFGYLFSIIGIFLGTTGAFYLARFLGRDAVHLFFGEERTTKFINQLNSKRAFAIIFGLFLIPGFPKDLISYAGGVSDFGYRPFIVLSLVGRTPALMATIMMGSMLHKGSYTGLIILAILGILLSGFCLIRRHWLTSYIDKFYIKLVTPRERKH